MKKILIIAVLIFLVSMSALIFLGKENITSLIENINSTPTPTRADDTGATPEGISTIVKGNNQFALDLYSKLKTKDENIFFHL